MKHKNSIFTHFLELLNVKYTSTFANKLYNEHPYKYNMLGLSKMLSDYNIKNAGIRLEANEANLQKMEVPFVAHTGSDFVVVKVLSHTKIDYIWQGKEISTTIEEFVKIWSGILLLAEPDAESAEPNYTKNHKEELFNIFQQVALLVALGIFVGLTYIFNGLHSSLGLTLATVVNIAGMYTSYLLVKKQMHIHSEYADKICSLFKQGDCNNVLESDAAKLWGVIGWSEVGLSYFSSNIIVILFFPQLITIMALINVCALPYSIWSIWYQKYKARQWCPLCLVVQALLWFLFAIHLFFGYLQTPQLGVANILLSGCIYVVPFLIINLTMPLLAKGLKEEQITQEINSIKATEEVFASLLARQPKYEVSKNTSEILFGNVNANILVTILTNPHCNPCGNMHKRIDRLLEHANNNNICVQYIFSSFDESLNSSSKFIIAAYQGKSEDESRIIINEWFDGGVYNKDAFFDKYPIDINIDSVANEFEKHETWRQETGIRATPTILVNGFKLPDNYKIEDLKYFSNLNINSI